jgi:quercetin dioxygenase-like cupin family protein
MDTKGFVVPPGGASVLSMAPGRSAALKPVGGESGDSILLFEETAPAGTETTFHLHRDSDEVAWVLSGEITFKIGDDVTVGGPGSCAFMPRGVPHAWKNISAETARVLFLYTPAKAGGFFEERLGRPAEFDPNGAEAKRDPPSPRLGDCRPAPVPGMVADAAEPRGSRWASRPAIKTALGERVVASWLLASAPALVAEKQVTYNSK